MDEHKMPLYCPFEGCQFNTEEIQTEQFGHHKRKLISHLGTFHDLFRNIIALQLGIQFLCLLRWALFIFDLKEVIL